MSFVENIEIRFCLDYDLVQWKYKCLTEHKRGAYEQHSRMHLVWKGMSNWFDKNVVLHYAQPQILSVPDDGKFHVGLYEYKHLWLILYQWVPVCMHFSLSDKDM